MQFRVSSYNCRGLGPGRLEYLRETLSSSDFCFIQEHWMLADQIPSLKQKLGNNFHIHGQSGMDETILLRGRPHGGTAIIWSAKTAAIITPVLWNSRRLCAVRVQYEQLDSDMLLINVYMPTDGGGNENVREFRETLQEISAVIESVGQNYVILGGDFNTDLSRVGSQHTRMLNHFLQSENLMAALTNRINTVDYTYENITTGSRSLIDHFMVSENLFDLLSTYGVEHKGYNPSDHSTLFMSVNIPPPVIYDTTIKSEIKPDWGKVSQDHIADYRALLSDLLDGIVIPHEAIMCQHLKCTEHRIEIDCFHDRIIDACLSASWETIPLDRGGAPNGRAGWDDNVNNLKKKAILWHTIWKDMGRPRNGIVADIRRQTRAQYHCEVRRIKKNQDKISAEKLACKKNVWIEVKKIKGKSATSTNTIDNATGKENIGKMFAEKFKRLYNSVSYNAEDMQQLLHDIDSDIENNCCNDLCYSDHFISVDDVGHGINALNKDKKDSTEHLCTNHFINGGHKLKVYISLLLNAMVRHGFCPSKYMNTNVVPIPKDQRKSMNSSDNYRGIALSSVLGKIMDNITIRNHGHVLQSCDAQFGFKPQLSTASCGTVVNEVIQYYNNKNTPVYCVSLDASKAFDCVHFVKMFRKLRLKGLCPIVSRFLAYLYVNQRVRVKWADFISEPFSVSNGVKQGGVLSPILFNLYLDELLVKLNKSGMGCHIGHIYAGVFAYADDILLLAPTITSLKIMLNITKQFSIEDNITFNSLKSKFIIFARGLDVHVESIEFNGNMIYAVDSDVHLGFPLGPNVQKARIDIAVNELCKRANMVMAYFAHACTETRFYLFKSFAMSLYGFQFFDMTDRYIENLYTAWRKSMRRVFNLPYRTHNFIIPIIAGESIEWVLEKRTVKFLENMFKSKNIYMNLCKNLILEGSGSSLANNMTHICSKYEVNRYHLDDIIRMVNNKRLEHDQEEIRKAVQITELIDMRDNTPSDGMWNSTELTEIINYLCVN